MPKIRITQERSKIRCIEKHKRTLAALGLRHPHHSVIHEDTPQIRGMVAQVDYLVRVEPDSGDGTLAVRAARPRRATPKAKAGAAPKTKARTTKKAAS